ncbi:hypothetical protein ACFPA8_21025 [Streptomyces ovatisporus]|uniref:Uncharacterized protein n=1 Tax=Streptomyces ovatisporus TaxID=1128682 RepID=A0ABV9AG64_9ACTN
MAARGKILDRDEYDGARSIDLDAFAPEPRPVTVAGWLRATCAACGVR